MTLDEIKTNIINWVTTNIGNSFIFRKYQLESIIHIINSIINNDRETNIIEAPTGSGKSLICIICAGVLSEYYNKKSYILCSDLFLWQQYASAIDHYNLSNFGYLKGSLGNYICNVNKQDFSCSKCRLGKVSFKQLRNREWRYRNFFMCYDTCQYMQDRLKAEKSHITLMTYQLWLHHMNLVNQNIQDPNNISFPKRDIIFSDECHNIPDIVQQFCSPTINEEYNRKTLLDIFKYIRNNDIIIKLDNNVNSKYKHNNIEEKNEYLFDELYDIKKIKADLNKIYNNLDKYRNDNKKLLKILNNYQDILYIIKYIDESVLSDNIKQESLFNTYKIDKEILSLSKQLNWFNTHYSSITDFIEAINTAGYEYLILDIETDEETRVRTFLFKCAKEDYLCYNYLLRHSDYKVMLSATVGMHNAFDENLGVKYTKHKVSYLSKIPSTFNFDKSPIYFIPTYKMNYANKNVSFPIISQLAVKIISANNVRGIIHTGSYENARIFYNTVSDDIKNRLLLYGSSKQKDEIIEQFKKSTNKILVGPTLTEGIDLPDDLCRFIILMKVPYPNITGNIVKKKIELFPLWYNSTTSNIIIQSIGRGVRNENDYCTTYILDGCFGQLYEQTKEQYPSDIQNRLKIIFP